MEKQTSKPSGSAEEIIRELPEVERLRIYEAGARLRAMSSSIHSALDGRESVGADDDRAENDDALDD